MEVLAAAEVATRHTGCIDMVVVHPAVLLIVVGVDSKEHVVEELVEKGRRWLLQGTDRFLLESGFST